MLSALHDNVKAAYYQNRPAILARAGLGHRSAMFGPWKISTRQAVNFGGGIKVVLQPLFSVVVLPAQIF